MRAADKPLEELQKGIACPPLQNSYKNVLTVWTKELTAVTTSWCSGTSCAVYFDLLNEPFWLKRHKLVPSSHRGCICLVAFVFPLSFVLSLGKSQVLQRGPERLWGLHPWRQSQADWMRSWALCDTKLVSFNLLWAGLFGLETSGCPFQRRLFFEAATWCTCATSAAVISGGAYPAKGGCCGCTGGRAHANQNQERWQWRCSHSGLFRWLFIPASSI